MNYRRPAERDDEPESVEDDRELVFLVGSEVEEERVDEERVEV